MDTSGYSVPDFSTFWWHALHLGNLDVALESERIARLNQIDVVQWKWCLESILIIIIVLLFMFLIFYLSTPFINSR